MFKEWDRVIVNARYGGVVNKKATVLGIDIDGDYMLRLDEKNGNHSCRGKCEDGHGFYVIPNSTTTLTLITNKEV